MYVHLSILDRNKNVVKVKANPSLEHTIIYDFGSKLYLFYFFILNISNRITISHPSIILLIL